MSDSLEEGRERDEDGITRRGALKGLGAFAAGAVATVALSGCSGSSASGGATVEGTTSNLIETDVPVAANDWTDNGAYVRNVQRMSQKMRGVDHQPGVTSAQQNLQAVAFDMTSTATRDDLIKSSSRPGPPMPRTSVAAILSTDPTPTRTPRRSTPGRCTTSAPATSPLPSALGRRCSRPPTERTATASPPSSPRSLT